MENGSRSVLSRFQQMMVVLMKLRLNLGDQDIAFRFGVNQSTVSRCFSEWIDVMYKKKNIKNVKRRRYGVPKSMQTRYRDHARKQKVNI